MKSLLNIPFAKIHPLSHREMLRRENLSRPDPKTVAPAKPKRTCCQGRQIKR